MPATSFDNSLYEPTDHASEGYGYGNLANEEQQASSDGMTWSFSDEEVSSFKPRSFGKSIRRQDVAEVTAQLAIMTRSGVDVASALASLASQCQRAALAEVLHEVHEAVLAGNTLSDALRQHTHVFEPNYVATVSAGEASGQMAEVLAQLAQMQRREIRSQRALKAMMTYPVLLMLVSSSVLVALVLFVLPRFADIFAQYEIALPVITQLLISLANELWARWWFWGPLVMGSLVTFILWRKTSSGRRCIDLLFINAPGISYVYRSQLVGRTCRLMGLMLQSGVPLVDSLRLTRQSVSNSLYKDLFVELEEAVINGRNLESVLVNAHAMPQSAREMIITAEHTGKLGEVTQLLGEYYEEEAEANMRQVVGLMEPIITVGMGILVAGVVLAVMLPVFDLSTLAGGGH